ncbi:carbohydrate ABC transporter permease [Engelhardtia mirabilis]|uniref:L-arabinose transport system permease protein AraQ n=1 Tax=Engelhardtia mirabilis TaxID=2528011 RepID=A0A518BIN2_9BACT|nr:L-arabinose transport system permease protein AraQ [Planctomycetes bacterium Pla133]QDV01157.1 L-arabinose transport system permease protein AraQ [Planctomycetes bacterium Pla86]
MRRSRLQAWLLYPLLVLVGAVWALPLFWMLSTSLKPESQALSADVGLLPVVVDAEGAPRSALEPAYWAEAAATAADNYTDVWTSPSADFPRYFRNSVLVASLSTLGMTLSSAIVAYALARLRWRGRQLVFGIVLATMTLPFTVLMAPQYLLFKHLGLIGTLVPLWLPAWFGGAFSIFLLRQFFLTLPKELDEAAEIDGCGRWATFWRVLMPNAVPALATVALLQFVASWNDFIAPLVFVNHQEQYTLALGLRMFQSQHGGTQWTELMAASVLTTAPVLVLFVVCQRFFVQGSASEGLKG